MKDINQRIAALSPEQRALFEMRLKQKNLEIKKSTLIPKRTASDTLYLSLSQERLWLLHQLQPDTPLYNESSLLRLTGVLNTVGIEKSINEIVKRHEILRTSFQIVDARTLQVIAPKVTFSLTTINIQTYTEAETEAKVQQIVTETSRQPFDLSQAPLLRGTLIHLSEQEHILLLTMHHIISDGWSWQIFYQELAALYQAFCKKSAATLPELSIQYADFALWQRQCLNDEERSHQLTYWKQQLKDAPPILNLPTDYPRPAQQSFRGARVTLIVPQKLTDALKSLSQQESVTLFVVLLAAFKTLLYRYTGQTDLLVGTPVANRTHSEIENLLGCFVNTLVLRTDLSNEPTFRELLARVRQTALSAYAHQDLPFEQLIKELQPERTLSHTPLFQVMFVFQDTPMLALQLPNLTLAPLMIDNGTAKFDLTLYVEDIKQGLIGFLEYNTDLFHTDTINRMLGHFQTLLEGIVANCDHSISNLPLLTPSEEHQLLVEFNLNFIEISHEQLEKCLHQLFEEQVEKTPDAVAVIFENQRLTYKELNQRANQLAYFLQKLGVRTEVLVGICVERSLEMLIGILGILKAGGAYVPLDPSYPQQRLAFMLKDAQLSILITKQNLVATLPQHEAQVVCLDSDWKKISKHSFEHLTNKTSTKNLAYVIYTSGSTGQPKGVQITHGSLVNFLSAMRQTPGLNQEDIFLSVTTLSFDIAALELYLPLIVGARIVIVSREVAADGIRLLKELTLSQATVMQATPATWRMLLAAGWQGTQQLKILCGGEALDSTLANQLLERSKQVWNLYGPTETTIWSSVHRVENTNQTERTLSIISIGCPIANTQFYILDQNQQLVPVGVTGELHIGGAGLARGYLNRPELNAQKFISHPFSNKPDARLYKTGDLARYLPDGNIEYLGRIDHQVKIRGFRIELGEIESVLCQHPTVREAVVLVQENQFQYSFLVAYIVCYQQPASFSELRSFVQQRLPEYMVPSTFVQLDALPLTPNGKVNRRALPAPEQTRFELNEKFVAPRTPVEEMLVGIWAHILGLKQIGIHDNFFDLGGHSLLATQILSQVRKAFDVELPLRYLFESPTVARLAKHIEMVMKDKPNLPSVPPLERVSRDVELPLSFPQQKLWFLHQLEPNSTAYNGSNTLLLQGSLNVAALAQSIQEIVRRHEVLRTSFVVVEGRPVQRIAEDLSVSLPIIDLQHLPESEREAQLRRLTLENDQQPFDLTNPPLLRLTLLRVKTEEHILLVTMHHIISDGWSAGVFIREISALYEAFSTRKPSPLPELHIQYADFAVWQQQWLQGEVLASQIGYWKKQLEGARTVLELPTDRSRSQVQTSIGTKYFFVISSTLVQSLKSLSQQEGATLFMTLMASFNALLYRYTHQEDILIGTPIANRNRNEIEGLIGFFVNTLVLRTQLSNNPSFKELLQRVREAALSAYTHQDLPFEKLVAELQPERHLNHTPLFQVWFVLQNAPMSDLKLPGINLKFLEADSGMVRHDLKLDLTETPEGIKGFFEYKTELFDTSTIAQMAELFKILLAAVVEQPHLKLSQLVEILNEAEKQQQILKNQEFKQARHQKLRQITRKPMTDLLQ